MYAKRLPAFWLVFLFMFLSGGVAGAEETNLQTQSQPEAQQLCKNEGPYVLTITEQGREQWKKLQPALPDKFIVRTDFSYVVVDKSGVQKRHLGFFQRTGTAGVFAGRYVLTVNHLAGDVLDQIDQIIKSTGVKEYEGLVIEKVWYRLDFGTFAIEGYNMFSLLHFDKARDVALLELKEEAGVIPSKYSLPVPVGSRERVDIFSLIVWDGNFFGAGPHPRLGYVSSLDPPQYPGFERPSSFIVSAFGPTVPGDSGGFVFALTPCGDYEWVGISIAIISTRLPQFPLSLILRADEVLGYLKSALDLRAVHEKFLADQKQTALKEVPPSQM